MQNAPTNAQSIPCATIIQMESRHASRSSMLMEMMIVLSLPIASMEITSRKNALLDNTSTPLSVSYIKINKTSTLLNIFQAGCLPLDDAPCSSHCSNLYGLNGYISCTQFETCIDNAWTIMTCDGTFVYDTTLGKLSLDFFAVSQLEHPY